MASVDKTVAPKRASNFLYVKPAKKRATQYEEITLHTQWDPKNFAAQGWFNLDKNGRPIWNEDSTLVRASDWWEYRDPAAEWFRPFVKRQADTGRAIEQAIAGAKRASMFADFDSGWAAFLANNFAAFRYADYGLFLVLCQAQREAGSDVVAQPIVFQSIEKDRHAQDITLYCMELEQQIPGFSDRDCKQVWLQAPEWQPLRKLVEKLLATRDWAEINLVVNLLLDPIVTALFLRELMLRSAPLNGDAVTPVIIEGSESDRHIRRASTEAFVTLLLQQNSDNKAIVEKWLTQWQPLVMDAAIAFKPLFSGTYRCAQSFEVALDRVLTDQRVLLQKLGLACTATEECCA